MGKIYLGDVGKVFHVETGIDCSTAILTEIHVLKPDEVTEVQWTAIAITNPKTGVDSILKYTTILASELDQVDAWKTVSYVEFSTVSKHYGEPDEFRVYNKYG